MSRSTILWKSALALCLFTLAASSVHAQGAIKWRLDYNTARKEAETKNLPMVIDFITDSCLHCVRMDNLTFTDPRIIATSNEQFIPLKVNYSLDPSLANHLKIDRFPTIVVAGPDGRVMEKKIGFQSADAMNDLLQTTILALAPTDAMKVKYLAALKMEAAGEYGPAISNLRAILDDGKPRAITKEARELLDKIEKRASDQLASAKALQARGQSADALDAFTSIARVFPTLPAGREASEAMTKIAQAKPDLNAAQRAKRARDLMDQAKEFYKSEDYIPCLDRCDLILASYGDLPVGPEAHILAGQIKNNPDWMQKAADVSADRLCGLWLALADSHLKRNEVRQAQGYLQRVIAAFPGSRLAESAQIRLNQLQGTVPARVDVPVSRPRD